MTTVAVLSPINLTMMRLFIAASAFLMLVTMGPSDAKAATLTDTQVKEVVDLLSSYDADPAVIRKVQEVLVQSQKRDNKGESSGASACGFLMKTLKRGHQGDDVKQLQEYLKKSGDFSDDSTGYFGPKTEEALKRIQARFQVVSSGDSETTGYGALGPRTRSILMERCKGALDLGQKPVSTTTSSTTAKPTCTLTADKSSVVEDEEVVLSWTTTNATHTSNKGGGQGPTEGSLTVVPDETTTYVKKAYGPGGVVQCTTTVTVTGSDDNSRREMVWNTNASLLTANTIDAIGSGVASAVSAYFGFFGINL